MRKVMLGPEMAVFSWVLNENHWRGFSQYRLLSVCVSVCVCPSIHPSVRPSVRLLVFSRWWARPLTPDITPCCVHTPGLFVCLASNASQSGLEALL